MMKNIFKTSLLTLAVLGLMASCSDDNGSNPMLQGPYEMTLFTPEMAANDIDLAESQYIALKCTYPNYGFPTTMNYTVEVALDEGMTDAIEVMSTSSPEINVPSNSLAIALTTLMVNKGMTEDDFPMEIPAYLRVVAHMVSSDMLTLIKQSRVVSNVVQLNNVKLAFSLPPVLPPTEMYVVGDFCGNNWDQALQMVQVVDHDELLWHMVYIDENGIKINEDKSDAGALTYNQVTITGDLAEDIVDNGGRIASSKPGWYLLVLHTTVQGRDRVYELEFRQPEVWLMGTVTPAAAWAELEDGCKFDIVGDGADATFVSPEFANSSAADSGVRAYVKLAEGIDWWRSEFRVIDRRIDYRANGGDQERIMGEAGQRMYVKFTTEEGWIE